LGLFDKFGKTISIKLISVILIGIILLAVILTAASTILIRSIFEQLYTEKLMTAAHVLLAQYTPDDFLPFIESLKSSESFVESAEKYLEDKLYVAEIEKAEKYDDLNLTEDYYDAKTRMAEYRKTLAALKDEDYYSVYKRLLEVRVGTGVKYLYVIADLGFDEMYVYLFDAVFQGDTVNADNNDFGTVGFKSNYPQIEKVFETGEAVLEYGSYRGDHSGSLCYSYTPLLDDYGNVIAVIGADINLQSLNSQLNNFLISSITLVILITVIITVVIIIMLREIIIKPVRKLTDISSEVAVGNIYNSIPDWIIKRNDEMGILGRSYESMNTVLQDVYSNNSMLFEAAISGKLDTRINPAPFKGLFAQLVEQTNNTLDIIGVYLDSIPGSLVVLNSDYDVVYTNQHYKQIFSGFTTKFIWQKILDDMENDDIDLLKKKFADIIRNGKYTAIASFEIEEETRWFSFMCNQIENNNGSVVIISDNTELVLSKDKALLANKSKSEFLSRVSHELRTPMNVITSMAKFGMNDIDIENNRSRFIKIVSASNHLAQIINNVLDMSRMESGKTEIRYAPMNLNNTVKTCIDLLMLKAVEKNLEFTFYINSAIPDELIGDEFRIRQILINLISNAIKFTDYGQVSVDVALVSEKDDKTEISFTVTDTGVGMSEEFLEKIFTPFEQEDLFLNRRYEGTGLGLSISHDLVLLMGGTMEVESNLGKGSKFNFSIPFTKSFVQTEEYKTKKNDKTSLAGKRILLVDDIDINRIIVREILADFKIKIEEAVDGQDAFEKFKKSPPGYYDCILMDIQMPVMDGYEATRVIRNSDREDNNIPVIAMTANALKEDVEDALNCGMNDHIAKPLDFDEVLTKLCAYLA